MQFVFLFHGLADSQGYERQRRGIFRYSHGMVAALIFPEEMKAPGNNAEVLYQERQKYIVITIKEPHIAPFWLIPGVYKTLMTYMKTNGINGKYEKALTDCFEKEYDVDGVNYMDVYIAIE